MQKKTKMIIGGLLATIIIISLFSALYWIRKDNEFKLTIRLENRENVTQRADFYLNDENILTKELSPNEKTTWANLKRITIEPGNYLIKIVFNITGEKSMTLRIDDYMLVEGISEGGEISIIIYEGYGAPK